jgi:hypothetical protein
MVSRDTSAASATRCWLRLSPDQPGDVDARREDGPFRAVGLGDVREKEVRRPRPGGLVHVEALRGRLDLVEPLAVLDLVAGTVHHTGLRVRGT